LCFISEHMYLTLAHFVTHISEDTTCIISNLKCQTEYPEYNLIELLVNLDSKRYSGSK
jgi:hypothetical protein